jgi:ABC-type spermidine/putrescine transport system permease subunit II
VALFLRVNGDAMIDSARTAGLVALGIVALGLGVSLAATLGARRAVWSVAWVLLGSALMPGVLVGSSILGVCGAVGWLRPVLEWPGIVAVGHLARFGFVVVVLLVWVERTEARELAALRRIDGADGPRGWAVAVLPARAPAIVAGAIVGAALSVHEIEAAVMLAPAGTDSLARRMLELLHFARERELAAGALFLLAGSLAASVLLVVLVRLESLFGRLVPERANRRRGNPIT